MPSLKSKRTIRDAESTIASVVIDHTNSRPCQYSKLKMRESRRTQPALNCAGFHFGIYNTMDSMQWVI